MKQHEYDLIVIGAGSGNTIPGPELSTRNIAIIDDGVRFGGTCLNVGCIPTKMFIHPGRIVGEVRDGARLGVHGDASAHWREVRDRIFTRIDAISDAGEQYRDSGEPNVTLFRQTVKFLDRNTLMTSDGSRLVAEYIVIAAGSRPRPLPQLPFGDRVISSDTLLRLDELPNRLAIVGGGVVAAEFASMMHQFGVEVTQVARSGVLGAFDADVARTFAESAAKRWRLHEHATITAAAIPDDPSAAVELQLSDGSTIEADLVLVAVGRIPNTDRLDTMAAGFDLHADGRLVVDDTQRVLAGGSVCPTIFALGDIANVHQLKHVANYEARVVSENLVRSFNNIEGPDAVTSLQPVPIAVFTDPEIATFGATLDDARAAGIDAFEVRQDYGGTAWGWALEDTDHFAKLVVDRETGQLLGAHIIGRDAAILLQPLIQAAAFNLPLADLARSQYWPHPAATEIIENLLLTAKEEYLA